jgi:hypothetical protein
MRTIFLTLGLSVSLWTLSSRAFSVEVRFQGTLGSSQEELISKHVEEFWSELVETYKKTSDPLLFIKLLPPTEMHGQWARTYSEGIILSSEIPKKSFPVVLRHEISHLYLLKICGDGLPTKNQIIHEAFALWAKKDFARFLDQNRFLYAKDAHRWFQKNGTGSKKDSKTMELALARLMSVANAKALDQYFKDLVTQCSEKNFKSDEWNHRLSKIFNFESEYAVKTTKVDFILKDGISGKVLSFEGALEKSFPTASTLKPLLFSLYPELISSRISRPDVTWACPEDVKADTIRQWNWKEALIKSCNGFFLDTKIENWKPVNELLEMFKIKGRVHSMAGAIGLIPEIEINLPQLLMIYQWLDLKSPMVVDALKQTSYEGTLSKFPYSRWFSSRGIALKTGTQRDIKSRPQSAWIIAVGPKDKMGRPSFYSAIHSIGASTAHLLNELKVRLEKVEMQNRQVQVGLLNLIPKNLISFSCPHEALMMKNLGHYWEKMKEKKISAGKFIQGASYACLGTGFYLHFPGAKKINESRLYYGHLKYEVQSEKETNQPDFLRENQLRARIPSSFILHTSLRYYLWGVLAAEFPNGRFEVLKTLASVARHNLEYYESLGKIICDNTFCQVFGPGQSLSKSISHRLDQAVENALSEQLIFPNGKRWLYFSLGGSMSWKTTRSQKTLLSSLQIEGLKKILKDNEYIKLVTDKGEKSFSCEVFRNQLRLKSCPDKIQHLHQEWVFEGAGEGHGMGLKLQRAQTMAAQGIGHKNILKAFYPELMTIKAY